MKTKFLVFLISISLLLSFSSAQAQTDVEDLAKQLREQINALQEKILNLQEELTKATEKLVELEQAIEFNVNLRSGTESEDVKNLQQFLSQYPDIYPESKVTGFFGPLTFQAIKRFQEKYADDVLKPYGLNDGTGFVGPATRAKLNELAKATPAVPATPATPAIPATPAVPGETPAVPAVPATPAQPAATTTAATTTPDTTAPANVTNFTATVDAGSAALSWVNPTDSDFAGAKIMKKWWSAPNDVTDGTQIYDGLGISTTDYGLLMGITYYYKVFTYDEVPNYSSGVALSATPTSTAKVVVTTPTTPTTQTPTPTTTTTTATDTTAPAISNFQPTGTTTDTTPTLSLSTNESATCKYASTTDQSYDSMPNTFSATGGTSHSVTVGPLATATYTYYARCQDSSGNKNTSSISTTFTVNPSAQDITAPVISSIQATSITTSSAAISWSTNEESTSVAEYGLTSSYGSTATGASNVVSHQVNLYNLASSTTYNYRVKSTDSSNNQAQSTNQTFTTLTPAPVPVADTTPPAGVTNFSATAGNGQIALSWTNPTDADFAGVKILRNTISFTSITDGTQVYSGTGASYTDTGLTNGTTYYYRIFTYDEVPNYSYYGNGASATPTAGVLSIDPSSVTALSVISGFGSLYAGKVAWRDNSNNVKYWDGSITLTLASNGSSVPSLYGGTMAWCDSSRNLKYWNGSTTQQIATGCYSTPSLHNGKIAWQDSGQQDIKYWNGSTITTIVQFGGWTRGVSLYDGKVAWSGGDQIYYWDGVSTRTISTSETGPMNTEPSLYNGTIAFVEVVGGSGANIWYWDGFSVRKISTVGNASSPSLYGGQIAYQAYKDGGYNIFYWDGVSTYQITTSGSTKNPSLYNGTLTYTFDNAQIYYWNGTGKQLSFMERVLQDIQFQLAAISAAVLELLKR